MGFHLFWVAWTRGSHSPLSLCFSIYKAKTSVGLLQGLGAQYRTVPGPAPIGRALQWMPFIKQAVRMQGSRSEAECVRFPPAGIPSQAVLFFALWSFPPLPGSREPVAWILEFLAVGVFLRFGTVIQTQVSIIYRPPGKEEDFACLWGSLEGNLTVQKRPWEGGVLYSKAGSYPFFWCQFC